jgi:hypothetical protein
VSGRRTHCRSRAPGRPRSDCRSVTVTRTLGLCARATSIELRTCQGVRALGFRICRLGTGLGSESESDVTKTWQQEPGPASLLPPGRSRPGTGQLASEKGCFRAGPQPGLTGNSSSSWTSESSCRVRSGPSDASGLQTRSPALSESVSSLQAHWQAAESPFIKSRARPESKSSYCQCDTPLTAVTCGPSDSAEPESESFNASHRHYPLISEALLACLRLPHDHDPGFGLSPSTSPP